MIYRTIITGIVALLLESTRAYAQFESIELISGPNYTSVRGESFNGHGFAFHSGIGANYRLTPKSLLSAQFIYEERLEKKETYNAHYRYVSDGDPLIVTGDVTYKNRTQCLTLPLLYNLKFGHKVTYLVGGGIYASWLMREVFEYGGERSTSFGFSFDYGVSAAFRVDIPLIEHWGIRLGIQDNLGLRNLGSDKNPSRYNVVSVMGGMRYKL